MSIRKMALVAALGMSMASAPVMAQTSAPVSSAPAVERSGATLDEANGQYNTTTTYIVAFFVIVAIGLGLYVAFNNDDDGRTSP
ncbi:MAG TPA: hypothetical protein VGB54_05060 [Allosphingosinicella sp.]|jgi:hypothetical protein